MKFLIDALEELFTKFSWRRLAGFAVGILFLSGCALTYEHFTSSFRLSRIEHEADVLTKLRDLELKGAPTDPNLRAVDLQLARELRSAASVQPISVPIPSIAVSLPSVSIPDPFPPGTVRRSIARFLAGGVIFWLVILAGASKSVTMTSNERLLFFALALASGLGTLLIPATAPSWAQYWSIPLAIGTMLLITISSAASSARAAARRRADEADRAAAELRKQWKPTDSAFSE